MNKIKMILADDEPIISRGIQKLIDFQSLGIEIVGVYEDGRAALEGIVRLRPEIALLDIAMPKMTGIDILKELNSLSINTQVIFISGFQDFEYAKSAVKYGASDYLLKPVIKDELIAAIERCVSSVTPSDSKIETAYSQENVPDLSSLIEQDETGYFPVLSSIIYPADCTNQMKQLLNFSFKCLVNDFVDENNVGIFFEKNQNNILILKASDIMRTEEIIMSLREKIIEQLKQKTFFIVGRHVDKMSEIPEAFDECIKKSTYSFFVDQLKNGVFWIDRTNESSHMEESMVANIKDEMISNIMSLNEENAFKSYKQFKDAVFKISAGKKENVAYYYCIAARELDVKMADINANVEREKINYLELARKAITYDEMTYSFYTVFTKNMETVKNVAFNSDKQSLIMAKEYIENHYSEDISLNILADVVHMNAYYFSTFFKKHSGMNFKEYVNKVRIEHALPLLISTDKKTYEIAGEVGFSDARSFSTAFVKMYDESPNSYRKRLRANS